MADLFLEIDKLSEKEKSEIIASFDTYTLKQWIQIVFNRIYSWIYKVIKKQSLQTDKSFHDVLKTNCMNIAALSKNEKRNLCIFKIGKVIHRINPFIRTKNVTTERLTTAITKEAASFLGKKADGASIAEKIDFVFSEYPKRKNINYAFIIICFFVLCLLLILIIPFHGNMPLKYAFLLWILLEIISVYFCERLVAKNQLRHFLWLMASVHGKAFAMETSSLPYQRLNDEEKSQIDSLFKLCHSFIMAKTAASSDISRIQNKIFSLQSLINENKRLIDKLSVSNNVEKSRIIDDKYKENHMLKIDIKNAQEVLSKNQRNLNKIEQIFQYYYSNLRQKLLEHWSSNYNSFIIEDLFVNHLVYKFSYQDLDKIESRFEELYKSHDPLALIEKDGSKYICGFRTYQGSIGHIVIDINSNHIIFSDIMRNDNPVFEILSSNELQKIMKSMRSFSQTDSDTINTITRLNAEIAERKQKEKEYISTISGLCEEKAKIEKENDKIEEELKAKEKDNRRLIADINEKAAECKRLKELLNSTNLNDTEYEILLSKYNNQKKALDIALQNKKNIEKQKKELEQLKEKNECTITKLQSELNSMKEKLKEQKKSLGRKIEEAEQAKSKAENEVTGLTNSINTYTAIIKQITQKLVKLNESAKQPRTTKEQLEKIREAICEFEDKKKKLENQIQISNSQKTDAEKKCKETEKLYEKCYNDLKDIEGKYTILIAQTDTALAGRSFRNHEGTDKVFVIDTSAFINCPDILDYIADNEMAKIPTKVIDEIDNIKEKAIRQNNHVLRIKTKEASENIKKYVAKCSQGDFRISIEQSHKELLPPDLRSTKPDYLILSVALNYSNYDTTIISDDRNLLLMAGGIGYKQINSSQFIASRNLERV